MDILLEINSMKPNDFPRLSRLNVEYYIKIMRTLRKRRGCCFIKQPWLRVKTGLIFITSTPGWMRSEQLLQWRLTVFTPNCSEFPRRLSLVSGAASPGGFSFRCADYLSESRCVGTWGAWIQSLETKWICFRSFTLSRNLIPVWGSRSLVPKKKYWQRCIYLNC